MKELARKNHFEISHASHILKNIFTEFVTKKNYFLNKQKQSPEGVL